MENTKNEEFNNLYKKLYDENFEYLNEMKNTLQKQNRWTLLIVIGIIIGAILLISLLGVVGVCIFIALIVGGIITIIKKASNVDSGEIKDYHTEYINRIIEPIISYAMPECEFSVYKGISEEEYTER